MSLMPFLNDLKHHYEQSVLSVFKLNLTYESKETGKIISRQNCRIIFHIKLYLQNTCRRAKADFNQTTYLEHVDIEYVSN